MERGKWFREITFLAYIINVCLNAFNTFVNVEILLGKYWDYFLTTKVHAIHQALCWTRGMGVAI